MNIQENIIFRVIEGLLAFIGFVFILELLVLFIIRSLFGFG